MTTTIQLSKTLVNLLKLKKINMSNELGRQVTYEDVIVAMLGNSEMEKPSTEQQWIDYANQLKELTS